MSKIGKVMVACDFSEYSPRVVGSAVDLAGDLNAELIIVNVINQRDVDAIAKVEAEYPAFTVERYLTDQKTERRAMMDDLLKETGGTGLEVRKEIRVGVPFKMLIQAVEEEGADLLVMGTKGRGNLAGVLFGSTAEKVFRRCPVPLLSIRAAE
ncbi:MAG TPA: universal stress protein [Desulfobacterales bacterium]